MEADLSASRGMFNEPRPPCLRGVLTQARWQKWLSVEQAINSQLILRNSSARSENAMISVGQTKVLQRKEIQCNECYTTQCAVKYLQIQGIKEENHIFSFVVFQRDFLELTINNSKPLENGRWFLDFRDRHSGFKSFEVLKINKKKDIHRSISF